MNIVFPKVATYPFHVTFVGLIDQVSTGLGTLAQKLPNEIPDIVMTYWDGVRSGKVDNFINNPLNVFKIQKLTVAEGVLDVSPPSYDLAHWEMGFNGRVRQDLYMAARKIGAPWADEGERGPIKN